MVSWRQHFLYINFWEKIKLNLIFELFRLFSMSFLMFYRWESGLCWVCSALVLFWLATVLQAKPLLGFLHQPILPRTSRQFNLWSTFFLGLVAQFTQHYTHWLHTESILWSHLLCRLYFSFCCFDICIQSHLWLLLVLYTFFFW